MDDRAVVAALFATAGLDLPDDELSTYVPAYRVIRAMVDSLYAVDETRDESPALGFNAEPGPTHG